jgi:hypothetical protein
LPQESSAVDAMRHGALTTSKVVYALSIQEPWLDSGEVGVVRLFGDLVQMRKYILPVAVNFGTNTIQGG